MNSLVDEQVISLHLWKCEMPNLKRKRVFRNEMFALAFSNYMVCNFNTYVFKIIACVGALIGWTIVITVGIHDLHRDKKNRFACTSSHSFCFSNLLANNLVKPTRFLAPMLHQTEELFVSYWTKFQADGLLCKSTHKLRLTN